MSRVVTAPLADRSPSRVDAANRAAVYVASKGQTGRLMFIHPRSQRAKVRLQTGYHVVVPVADVELVAEVGS